MPQNEHFEVPGGMYFVATFTSMLLLVLLRFGPRPPSARHPSLLSLQLLGEVARRVDSIHVKVRQEELSTLPIISTLLPERQEHLFVKFSSSALRSELLNFH